MSDALKPGDHVVHAVHGPGEVVAVQMRDTPAGPVEYVTIEQDRMRILIPTAELQQVGVREPISAKDAEAILELLTEDPDADPGHTERRRVNARRVTGGDAEELARVIGSLRTLKAGNDKALAMHDKNHLSDATDKLVGELAIALGITEAQALARVEKAIASSLDDDEAAAAEVEEPVE